MRVWVTLGYFDERGDGTIVELDASDGSVREVLSFDPPESLRVPHKGFTGAAWTNGSGREDRRHEAAFTLCHPFEFT